MEEWPEPDPPADASDEDAAAVQEAFDDLARGDPGIPFDVFDREFRRRHGIPA